MDYNCIYNLKVSSNYNFSHSCSSWQCGGGHVLILTLVKVTDNPSRISHNLSLEFLLFYSVNAGKTNSIFLENILLRVKSLGKNCINLFFYFEIIRKIVVYYSTNAHSCWSTFWRSKWCCSTRIMQTHHLLWRSDQLPWGSR